MSLSSRKRISSGLAVRVRALLALGVIAGALLGVGLGFGERTLPGEPRSLDPIIAIAQLPASIDAVVVVEDAASLRVSDAGSAVVAALVETGLLAKTTRSWDELASSLGWTPVQAFDELFGRRVVLALDDIEGKKAPRWVVLADVDESTSTRIRKKLKLAPRTIAHNARVLSGERGRFRLAVIPGKPGSGMSSLLIAPVEHKSLFFRTLKAITDPQADLARFGETRGYRQLTKLERRPIRLVVQPAPDAGSSETFFAMSARCDRGDWVMHFVGSPDVLGVSSDAAHDVYPWPRRAFGRLSEDAMVSVMSVTGRMDSNALGPLGHVATGLLNVGGAARVLAAAGSVQMIAIHRPTPTVPVGVESTKAEKRPIPQIGLTIAAQSEEPDDTAAIDAALAGFISHVTATTDAGDLDLQGAFPGAMRSVTVAPGERSELAWFHRPDENVTVQWAQTPTRWGDAPGAERSWWVVQIAGRNEAARRTGRLRDVVGALAQEPGGGADANRISMGVIKPRELVDWLTDLGMDETGELAIFQDIERFGWEAWTTPGPLVEGQMRLTVRPGTSNEP